MSVSRRRSRPRRRVELLDEIATYRVDALDDHPWRDWIDAAADAANEGRLPGGQSRWNATKDLSWEPLRAELVAEVAYEHMQGDRFRHATRLLALAARQEACGLRLRAARDRRTVRAGRHLRRLTASIEIGVSWDTMCHRRAPVRRSIPQDELTRQFSARISSTGTPPSHCTRTRTSAPLPSEAGSKRTSISVPPEPAGPCSCQPAAGVA